MARISAETIQGELAASYLEARLDFLQPDGNTDNSEYTLLKALVCEAYYAVDRYRPSEHDVLSDQTDDSIDELAEQMALEAMPAVMELAHAMMAKRAAAELGGRVYRVAA